MWKNLSAAWFLVKLNTRNIQHRLVVLHIIVLSLDVLSVAVLIIVLVLIIVKLLSCDSRSEFLHTIYHHRLNVLISRIHNGLVHHRCILLTRRIDLTANL